MKPHVALRCHRQKSQPRLSLHLPRPGHLHNATRCTILPLHGRPHAAPCPLFGRLPLYSTSHPPFPRAAAPIYKSSACIEQAQIGRPGLPPPAVGRGQRQRAWAVAMTSARAAPSVGKFSIGAGAAEIASPRSALGSLRGARWRQNRAVRRRSASAPLARAARRCKRGAAATPRMAPLWSTQGSGGARRGARSSPLKVPVGIGSIGTREGAGHGAG
jgi:hypothetical protein